MGDLAIGLFSFPLGVLTSFAAVVTVLLLGHLGTRRGGPDIEPKLWIVIGAALLAARAVYVARFADLYLAAPVSILDIRDGGFHLKSGLLAGAVVAGWLTWRDKAGRKPILAATLAGAAVFLLVAIVQIVRPAPTLNLPQLALERIEGGSLALAGLAGKPVALNIWASWCGPCRREIPALRKAQLAHPEITFVFVNQGEAPEVVGKFLGGQNITLANVVLDRRHAVANALGAKGLPTTFFFDSKGVLQARRAGELSHATLAEKIALIQPPKPPARP
ncbi:TlpA disulfide reductase family protein [Massilia glaciei]|nr:TlpA disulfide reductase family protein [Massilia glaciei]